MQRFRGIGNPLLFTSLLFTAICKVSSDIDFAFFYWSIVFALQEHMLFKKEVIRWVRMITCGRRRMGVSSVNKREYKYK